MRDQTTGHHNLAKVTHKINHYASPFIPLVLLICGSAFQPVLRTRASFSGFLFLWRGLESHWLAWWMNSGDITKHGSPSPYKTLYFRISCLQSEVFSLWWAYWVDSTRSRQEACGSGSYIQCLGWGYGIHTSAQPQLMFLLKKLTFGFLSVWLLSVFLSLFRNLKRHRCDCYI